MIYDFVIVGGGLGGLYTFYYLKSQGFKRILLLESSDRVGGRIDTIYLDERNIWLERGAARFNDIHDDLLNLLVEFGLKDKIRRLPIPPIQPISVREWKKIDAKMRKTADKSPNKLVINSDFILSTGYEELFSLVSSSAFGEEWIHYKPGIKHGWYDLEGGLSQLIDKLLDNLPKRQICYSEPVLEVKKSDNIWKVKSKKREIKANNIVLCVQPSIIREIIVGEVVPRYAKYNRESLCRVYVRTKSDISWLEKRKVFYRSSIDGGQCLYLGERSEESGWFELYYTGAKGADKLMRSYTTDSLETRKKWEKIWKTMTGTELIIDEVLIAYWYNGVEWYAPQEETLEDYLFNLREWSEVNRCYMVGDSFSMGAGWMNHVIRSVKDQKWNFFQRGGKSYTMSEVERHNSREDAWIVISGKVYDITSWIPIHPGGYIIMEGVGRDATDLFERVHPNLIYPRKILSRYYIGELQK